MMMMCVDDSNKLFVEKRDECGPNPEHSKKTRTRCGCNNGRP